MTQQTKNETPNEKMTNSITKNTEPKSCNEECKDIGKVWKRNCPKCNVELTYYSRQNLWRANKNKCLCGSCSKSGDRNPTKQDWVRKKIGIAGTKYNLPDKIELVCNCGNKWMVGKRNYIFYYLNRNKIPLCVNCINQFIADNISEQTKNNRSIKMSQIMKGRKILWIDKINKTWNEKSESEKLNIYRKISDTHSRLILEGKIKFNTGYKTGYYTSSKTGNIEYYHSSWELNKMRLLDMSDNVVEWTKNHTIRIPYLYNNNIHHYVPDFLIKMADSRIILEEVKGYIKDKVVFDLKCIAAKKYCQDNNIEYKISYDNCTQI